MVAAPTALNFIGLGVTAANNADVADITMPVLPIEDETVETVADPSAIDFAGAGVTVTDVAGVADVTIPENFLPIEDEGSSIVAAPSALNYVGAGVTVTDVAGVATVTVPAAAGGETFVESFKQVDTSRASTTTLADDPELLLTGMSQGRWFIECRISRGFEPGAPTSGIQIRWRVGGLTPITSTNIWLVDLTSSGAVTDRGADDPTTIISWTPGSALDGIFWYRAIIDVTTGSTGTLFFQWAQLTSDVDALILRANSFVRATRLGDR